MTQARLKPLDNAEQDYVLRQRLSHPLSHRPLLSIRSKLSTSRTDPTAASSLLAEVQSYLLSLTRTHVASTSTTTGQIEEYERQYAEIQAEEEASTARIVELKQQLEEVRRRRREKIEYGRVAESIERWFKTGSVDRAAAGVVEIEESLSTLVSHLTSSFLYNSDPSTSTTSDSAPNHSATLTQLHSHLNEMLNLSRQVREIVGWKSGPSGSGSSNSRNTDASQLNPNAKPFQPLPAKRALNNTDLEEGEAVASPTSSTGKRQKVQMSSANDDEDDEEGSIPAPAAVTSSSTRRAPPASRTRAPRGRGRGKSGWD